MTHYGVLISNKRTGEQLAVLELDPSGMLITSSFTEKIPPISLPHFVDRFLDQPIYKKYVEVLTHDKVLSAELMENEIKYMVELINMKPMSLGGVRIVARSAQHK